MREIKFRAKHFSGIIHEWFYGVPVPTDFGSYFMPEVYDNRLSYGKLYATPIDKDTIGQFTGLYDKNGNEIYEGDILQYGNFGTKIVVEFKHGMFCYKTKIFSEYLGFGANDNFTFQPKNADNNFEVVGNIYDNKELLNKEI